MRYNVEPTAFKAHSFTVTPWKLGACEDCGIVGKLRFSIADRLFLCFQCSLDHLVADRGRLEWLWSKFDS
jgi:hypothetical protein